MKKAFILPLLLPAIVLVGCDNPAPSSTASQAPSECDHNTRMYLSYLKDGYVAKEYWKPGVTPRTLYAVNDYRSLEEGFLPQEKLAFYTYEINSTTREGVPIRKRWHVLLDPKVNNADGKPCAIVDMLEAEQ